MKINSEISFIQDQIKDINDVKFVNVNTEVEKKIEMKDLSMETMKINKRMDGMVSIEVTDQLEYKFDSFSANLEDKVYMFITQCKENREIIQRFDDILCDKASKMSITEVKESLINYSTKKQFEQYKVELKKDLDTMCGIIVSIDEKILSIQKEALNFIILILRPLLK